MSYFKQDLRVSLEKRKLRLKELAPFSRTGKGMDFTKLDRGTFDIIEQRVLAEAGVAAQTSGKLFASYERDDTGRKITTYEGDQRVWLAPFMSPGATFRINKEPGVRHETVKLLPGQKIVITDK